LTSREARATGAGVERIAIVGCSGGGKSTLARALGTRLGLPVIHMDTLFWKAGWTESDHDEFRAKVEAAAAGDVWVMEGGFITHSARRFERADTVIWIELPMLLCLWRAIRRMLLNFGRTRADLAPGCPERFDLAFYHYIWTWNRLVRPRMTAALAALAPHTRLVRLTNDRQTRQFLATLPRNETSL
jgi:adenylate kinase family enzyme